MKLINKLKKASDKTKVFQDARLSKAEAYNLVCEIIMDLPAGHYRLHSREYGTNIVDTVYEVYGWMPSMFISQEMLLGLQALHPKKVYASFTLGLDAIEVKR